jgi:hypothetical protein
LGIDEGNYENQKGEQNKEKLKCRLANLRATEISIAQELAKAAYYELAKD